MLSAGLLTDESGNMSQRTKAKVLELLGFGTLSGAQDITNLHIEKAQRENISMMAKEEAVEEFDEHELHITEHTRALLTEDFSCNKKAKERILSHLNSHKTLMGLNLQEVPV